jgi:hypothetical protein
MDTLRQYLRGKTGVALAVLMLLIGIPMIYRSGKSLFGASPAAELASRRLYICAQTNKAYEITLTPTTPCPAPSPYSGKDTGYPAELCYWTKDGQIKSDPTPVLLRMWVTGNPSEVTFCPDCGRLVVLHNPRPHPGDRPPPTREQYEARLKSLGESLPGPQDSLLDIIK